MTENEKPILQVNILKNRYLTDGNIWTIDETIFNIDTKLFMIINLKTRAILGYILHQNILNEELIIELYQELFNQYNFDFLNFIFHLKFLLFECSMCVYTLFKKFSYL